MWTLNWIAEGPMRTYIHPQNKKRLTIKNYLGTCQWNAGYRFEGVLGSGYGTRRDLKWRHKNCTDQRLFSSCFLQIHRTCKGIRLSTLSGIGPMRRAENSDSNAVCGAKCFLITFVVCQLVKKSHAFLGTGRFSVVFAREYTGVQEPSHYTEWFFRY